MIRLVLLSAAALVVWQGTWPTKLATIALLALAVAVWWRRWPHPRIDQLRRVLPRSKSASTVGRWGDKSRRKSGMASPTDIWRDGSWRTMRRMATVVRPSLAQLTRWERLRQVRTSDVAVRLCRVGWLHVWASVEGVICVVGGPRYGKTGWLAGRIIDAPGAVIATSTRTDLYDWTAPLRRRRGGPVHVFNPVGLAGMTSTVTFDPLTGCKDPVTPAERAADMVPVASNSSGDGERWSQQARRVLAALMHAAALGDHTMHTVLEWVADPPAARPKVISLLRQSPAPAYRRDVEQFFTTNDRTQTSITSTLMPALLWLNSPDACAAAAAGTSLDVADLLRTRGSVYLLGKEEAHTAPLVTALTGHIAREARRLAAARGGRLDPNLTLALDEAAQIATPPLDLWTADMGGAGITIIMTFQSRAQMIKRYGDVGAGIIMNNTAATLIFGGTQDDRDLAAWMVLLGKRDETVETTDGAGKVTSRTVRQVPVIQESQLSNLPPGRVVLRAKGMPPSIGKAPMVWNRRDVRAQQRRDRRAARTVDRAPSTTPVAVPAAVASLPAAVALPAVTVEEVEVDAAR